MYSLKQAAEAAGRGKPAILRAIQKGVISATRNSKNEWVIDPSELHRVYPPITRSGAVSVQHERIELSATPDATVVLHQENALLKEKIELLQEERQRERKQQDETISDLRRRLDQSETERRDTQGKLTALLTYQPEPKLEAAIIPAEAEFRSGFLERLLGKKIIDKYLHL